jgi:hypothetical protein
MPACVRAVLTGLYCTAEESVGTPGLRTVPSSSDEPARVPMYYLNLFGTQAVTVTDALGNRTSTIDKPDPPVPVPGVTVEPLGETGHVVLLPTDTPLTVTLRTASGRLAVDLRQGTGTTATAATRYQDLGVASDMPPGSALQRRGRITSVSIRKKTAALRQRSSPRWR